MGDNASKPRTPSRKSWRLATVGLTPVKKTFPATTTTTTPVTVSAPAAADVISPLKQGIQLDGPQMPRKEPKPTQTPTPESAVASTSGVGVAKKKKRGRPKQTPKAPKSTEVTPQESDTSMVEGGKEPSKPEQTTPTTTKAASADATVVQDEGPDVNQSSSPIPPSDMNNSKVGQASAAVASTSAAVASTSAVVASTSAAVASTSAASAFARTPTKEKKNIKRKAADRFANIYTDSEDEANRETQSTTGHLTFTLKKTPLVNLTPEKTSKQKKKKTKTKSKSKKSDTSYTDSYRREVEERRTKAIEDMAKSWSEPVVKSPVMPTPAAVVVEELDDDKLSAKLLVRRIKEIKDEDMKEDF